MRLLLKSNHKLPLYTECNECRYNIKVLTVEFIVSVVENIVLVVGEIEDDVMGVSVIVGVVVVVGMFVVVGVVVVVGMFVVVCVVVVIGVVVVVGMFVVVGVVVVIGVVEVVGIFVVVGMFVVVGVVVVVGMLVLVGVVVVVGMLLVVGVVVAIGVVVVIVVLVEVESVVGILKQAFNFKLKSSISPSGFIFIKTLVTFWLKLILYFFDLALPATWKQNENTILCLVQFKLLTFFVIKTRATITFFNNT